MMRTQTNTSKSKMTYGVDSEIANEAELELYFCDVSPVEHASLLATVDTSIDAASMSLLLQGAWQSHAMAVAVAAPAAH